MSGGTLDDFLDASGRDYLAKLRAKKPRQPRAPTAAAPPKERDVQRAILSLIRACVPGGFAFAVPNQSGGSTRERAHLISRRLDGVRAGVPDLCVLWPGGGCLYIEVKRPGGRVSGRQAEVHDTFAALGQRVAVVHSVDEAADALRAAGAPVRGTTRLRPAVPAEPLR